MRISLETLFEAKRQKRKITAISCYDYITARILSDTNISMLLVGDSAAQLVLGFESTLPATMDFMVAITAAVRRGAPEVFLAADMPFLSFQTGISDAVKNAGRFFTEAGAQIVKIEVSAPYLDVVKAINDAGMPVMAHIGIKPQMIAKLGKLKAEGTTAEMAMDLINFAQQCIKAGASALLIEGTASEAAEIITKQVDVPVISCGSGSGCDGQILVAPDILGLTTGPAPKFVKNYANLAQDAKKAFIQYIKEVSEGEYPENIHNYRMKSGEFEKLKKILNF